ncbi:hypothetical protein JKP88DRAFT_349586 [Tribonema minus]|uniref:Uncharacterized protein n=1 Tax=Tribonema minus TaxID=303371 RepID=A0A835YUV6_9STRA|nr:hypothetical protein JKP88DRAFT_349586 [Tribonema minus]
MADDAELATIDSGDNTADASAASSPLPTARDAADSEGDFFQVVAPLDLSTFLSATREVLETSLMLFAPLGLPPLLKRICPSEAGFLETYGPRFRAILEAVSEAVYEARGISESEMSVTIHKLVTEERDAQAVAAMRDLGEALKFAYDAPDVLELPCIAPVSALADFAAEVTAHRAAYLKFEAEQPQQQPPDNDSAAPAPPLPPPEPRPPPPSAAFAATMYPGAFAALGYALPQRGALPAAGAMEGGGGDAWERSAALRALAALRPALARLQRSQGLRPDAIARAVGGLGTGLADSEGGLLQRHVQALVDSYRAGGSSGVQGGGSGGDSGGHAAALRVIDDAARLPFAADPLFLRVLELEGKAAGDAEGEAEEQLADIFMAERYEAAAYAYLERGDFAEAARRHGQAFDASFGAAPASRSAHFLARRAAAALSEVRADERDGALTSAAAALERCRAAARDAEAALGLDECCAGAWAARAAARRMVADDDGDSEDEEGGGGGDADGPYSSAEALRDMVRAFVLDACGTWAPVEEQAAAIEEVAREACRAEAHRLFTQQRAAAAGALTLPPPWLSRSYFESFTGELDGSYYRRRLALSTAAAPPLTAEPSGIDEDSDGSGLAAALAALRVADGGAQQQQQAAPPLAEAVAAGARAGAALSPAAAAHAFDAALVARAAGDHRRAMQLLAAARAGADAAIAGAAAAAAAAATAAAGADGDGSGAHADAAEASPHQCCSGDGKEGRGGGHGALAAAAHEQLASYLYLAGDMAAAEAGFRRAAALDARSARARVKLASLLCDMDDRAGALEWFRLALEADPSDADVYLHRGQYHLLTNNPKAASFDLQRAAGFAEAPAVAQASYGISLFKRAAAPQGSLRRRTEVMRSPPINGALILITVAAARRRDARRRGLQLGMSQEPYRMDQALRILKDASWTHPDSVEVALFHSEVLTHLGDFAGALALLAAAAAKDPSCPLPYVNAGRAFTGMGDLPSARRHLARAMQVRARAPSQEDVDPLCSGAYLDFGQVETRAGHVQEAMRLYEQGVHCSRYLSELHDALACLTIARTHLEAKAYFERRVRLLPPLPTAATGDAPS